MSADNRDREPLPGAPGGEIDDGWGPWRTDISEWDVTTHDVRFECVGGIHKISTRPRADLPPRPAEPAPVDVAAQLVKLRETFCFASPGSDEGITAWLEGFDAAVSIIAAAQEDKP